MSGQYPMGARVTYTARAEVEQGSSGPLTATGVVNGAPITDEDGDVVFVPVWTQRDHEREATTIMVHVANIIGVTDPGTSP